MVTVVILPQEVPLLLWPCSLGALWDQDFKTPHHLWNQNAHCSVHHTQVPSRGFDLPSPGLGCCYSMPHLWVLNHNFNFYHWGSTAALPHPIFRVLNCGFVPTALELNCCYSVNVPWGQRQNLDPPSPGCAAIATCHLGPSYCCTLLSQGLCQCYVTSPSP